MFARDVGASYGFFAVAALAGYLLSPRYRAGYLAATVAYALAAAAVFHTFTDFGHLTAVAIGLACYPIIGYPTAPARARISPRLRHRARANAKWSVN